MRSLPASTFFIAGFFLLGSTDAADFHWLPKTPGDGTSGSLTIPDADDTPGPHVLFPPPSGSWEDAAGNVYLPSAGSFFVSIFPDGVLLEGMGSNLWESPAGQSFHFPTGLGVTGALDLLPSGAPTTFQGRWVPDSTGVPDGGSTLFCLIAGLSALGIAGRRAKSA